MSPDTNIEEEITALMQKLYHISNRSQYISSLCRLEVLLGEWYIQNKTKHPVDEKLINLYERIWEL